MCCAYPMCPFVEITNTTSKRGEFKMLEILFFMLIKAHPAKEY